MVPWANNDAAGRPSPSDELATHTFKAANEAAFSFRGPPVAWARAHIIDDEVQREPKPRIEGRLFCGPLAASL